MKQKFNVGDSVIVNIPRNRVLSSYSGALSQILLSPGKRKGEIVSVLISDVPEWKFKGFYRIKIKLNSDLIILLDNVHQDYLEKQYA
jgi:hypothetical protein